MPIEAGAQDELVFDGGSMVVDEKGCVCQVAGFFSKCFIPWILISAILRLMLSLSLYSLPSLEERLYKALVLGLRDYVEKNNFPSVFIGVSGGIDSALTLAIAVDALGPKRVKGVFLPSRYTTDLSQKKLPKSLKISVSL